MKVAILLVFLYSSALLIPQQISSVGNTPPDHPGQKALMLSQRDLYLVQTQSWLAGYEASQLGECQAKQIKAEVCESQHIEAEQGSDPETIRLHAYYPATQGNNLAKPDADAKVALIHFLFGAAAPKWLKWERRDNGGAIEAMK